MYITVNGVNYELSTKLGTGKKIEARFKKSISEIFGELGSALSDELLDMILIAAGKTGDKAFVAEIDENWDFSDLFGAGQELVANLMYSGTPEQVEAKIEKHAGSDEQKNALRKLLRLPNPAAE